MADARIEAMQRAFGVDLSPRRSAYLKAVVDTHLPGLDMAHCAVEACSAAWPCGPRFDAERELYTIGVMTSIAGEHQLRIHLDIVVWLRSEIARRSAVQLGAAGYHQVQASLPNLVERLAAAEEILVDAVRPYLPRAACKAVS